MASVGKAVIELEARFLGLPNRFFLWWFFGSACVLAVLTTLLILRPINEVEVQPELAPVPELAFTFPNGGSIVAKGDMPLDFSGNIADLLGQVQSYDHRQALGEGAGVTNVGSFKYEADFNGTAPEANVDGASSSGGAIEYSMEFITSNSGMILVIAGAAMAAGGVVVLVWLGMKKLGFALIAAGGSVALIGFYPWFLLVAIGLALVVAGVAFYDMRKTGNRSKLFEVLVTATQNAGESGKAVKSEVEKAARAAGVSGILRKEVNAAKSRL